MQDHTFALRSNRSDNHARRQMEVKLAKAGPEVQKAATHSSASALAQAFMQEANLLRGCSCSDAHDRYCTRNRALQSIEKIPTAERSVLLDYVNQNLHQDLSSKLTMSSDTLNNIIHVIVFRHGVAKARQVWEKTLREEVLGLLDDSAEEALAEHEAN